MLKRVVAVALLVGSVPVFAQPNAQAPGGKDPNRKICEKAEKEIGSLVSPRRVCMTAQQWEDQRRLNREAGKKPRQGTGSQNSR